MLKRLYFCMQDKVKKVSAYVCVYVRGILWHSSMDLPPGDSRSQEMKVRSYSSVLKRTDRKRADLVITDIFIRRSQCCLGIYCSRLMVIIRPVRVHVIQYNLSTSFTYKDVINRDRSSKDNNWTMEFPWSKSIFCAFYAVCSRPWENSSVTSLSDIITSQSSSVQLSGFVHAFIPNTMKWNLRWPILCCDCRQCRWGLIRSTSYLKVWWPFHSAWCFVWLWVRVEGSASPQSTEHTDGCWQAEEFQSIPQCLRKTLPRPV